MVPQGLGLILEEQGDAPKSGDSHQDIDGTAEHRGRSAADPRHQIETKNAHDAPVQAADDGQDQGDLIQNSHIRSLLGAAMGQSITGIAETGYRPYSDAISSRLAVSIPSLSRRMPGFLWKWGLGFYSVKNFIETSPFCQL